MCVCVCVCVCVYACVRSGYSHNNISLDPDSTCNVSLLVCKDLSILDYLIPITEPFVKCD